MPDRTTEMVAGTIALIIVFTFVALVGVGASAITVKVGNFALRVMGWE